MPDQKQIENIVQQMKVKESQRPSVKNAKINDANAPSWKEWTPLAGLTPIVKPLEALSKGLKTVRNVLAKGLKIISKIEWMLEWLEKFEKALQNALYTFLDQILSQLEMMLRDLRSTGVYFFDLTTYHIQVPKKKLTLDEEYQSELESLKAYYNKTTRDRNDLENDAMDALEARTAERANQTTVENPNTSIIDTMDEWLSDMLQTLSPWDKRKTYLAETYEEFIEYVCTRFYNPKDTPGESLISKYEKQSVNKPPTGQEYTTSSWYTRKQPKSPFEPDGEWSRFKDLLSDPKEVMRTGKPDFGPMGHFEVILIVLATINISELIRLISFLMDFFKNMFKDGVSLQSIGGALAPSTGNLISSIMANPDAAIAKMKPKTDKIIGPMPPAVKIQPACPWPYFVGVNMGTFLGKYFDEAQRLINLIRTLRIPSVLGFVAIIKDMLKALEDDIRKLMELINTIDNIIAMIVMALKLTGFRVLHVKTDKGVDDAVKQIRAATGFAKQAAGTGSSNYEKTLDEIEEKNQKLEQAIEKLNLDQGNFKKIAKNIDDAGFNHGWLPENVTKITDSIIDLASSSLIASTDPSKASAEIIILNERMFPEGSVTKSQVQKWYIELWTILVDINDCKKEIGDLSDELENLENNLAEMDPGASESFKQRRNVNEIEYQNTLLDTTQTKLTKFQTIVQHLEAIKIAVIDWHKYMYGDWDADPQSNGSGIKAIIELKNTKSVKTEEETANDVAINNLLTKGKTVGNATFKSTSMLESLRNAVVLAKDQYNGGIESVPGMTARIQEKQQAITALDQQHGDPNAVPVIDYETERAKLVVEMNSLISQQTTKNTEFDYKIAEYDYAINVASSLSASSETTNRAKLEILKDNPNYLTNNQIKGKVQRVNDANESLSGSIAQKYRERVNFQSRVDVLELSNRFAPALAQKLQDITVEKNSIRAQLIVLGYNVDEHKRIDFKTTNTTAPFWTFIGVSVNSCTVHTNSAPAETNIVGDPIIVMVNTIIVSYSVKTVVGGLTTTPAIDKQDEYLFHRYWECQDIIELCYIQERYILERFLWPFAISNHEKAIYSKWQQYNKHEQTKLSYAIGALEVQSDFIHLTNINKTLSDARNAVVSTCTNQIKTITDYGYSRYLSMQEQWAENRNDSIQQVSEDWAGYETQFLIRFKNWDIKNPKVEVNGEVPNRTLTCKTLDDSISQYQYEAEKVQKELDVMQKKIKKMVEQEEKRIDNNRKKSRRDRRESLTGAEWTPDTKMFFAGFMICYGWPGLNQDGYFNYSDTAANFHNDPAVHKVATASNKFKDLLKKLIRYIF